jgi:protein-S-isoprenylcysteine O-methyltransferase Ste14
MIRIGNFLFHYRNGLFPLAFVLLIWKGRPIFNNDLLAAGIGFSVALLGQALRALTIGLAYIIRGGKKRQVYAEALVTDGLFSHCRNPLYVGNLLILAGVGLAANSLLFMAVGMPFFLFAYRAIVAAEENYLRGKFGQEFDEYCARVNRFLPSLSGIGQTMRSMEFNWSRLVVKEYGSAFAWMAGGLLLVMKNLWQSRGDAVNNPVLWTFAAMLLLVILGYATARYLKKSRVLRAS